MTQHEFETRTNVALTADLFWEVNEEYNESEKDIDAFCKWWIKHRQLAYTKRMAIQHKELTQKVEMLEIRVKERVMQMSDMRRERDDARAERNRLQAQYNELSYMLAQIKEIINA